MNLSNIKFAVIGLGYVGLPLAVEFGKKRSVVGFDINQKRISELKESRDFTLETEPEELQAAKHLTVSTQLNDLGYNNGQISAAGAHKESSIEVAEAIKKISAT